MRPLADGLKPYVRSKSPPVHRPMHDGVFWILSVGGQPFFGALGCASAIIFTTFGAAYGTAKSGVGICSSGILRPDLIVKSMPG